MLLWLKKDWVMEPNLIKLFYHFSTNVQHSRLKVIIGKQSFRYFNLKSSKNSMLLKSIMNKFLWNVHFEHVVAPARNDAAWPLYVEDLLLAVVPDLQLLVPPRGILNYFTKVSGSRVDHQHLINRKCCWTIYCLCFSGPSWERCPLRPCVTNFFSLRP